MSIFYNDQKTEVALGDRVELRVWFRRRRGVVIYVPGVSPLNPNIDYDGIRSVGIQIDEGPFVATPVDPDQSVLFPRISFLARGEPPEKVLPPDLDPFAD